MVGSAILVLLILAVAIPAIVHAVRPGLRSRRRAIIAVVVIGALGVLSLVTGLIKAFAGVAGLDPSLRASALGRAISESMNCTACGVVALVVLWAVPFAIGEVRRRRGRREGLRAR